MNTVFLSRIDETIPWGFRLQGGADDDQPFILTHIQPNSPADGKIDSGDILREIAGTNITKMTHRDTLELIQRCGNALHMTVFKIGQADFNSNRKQLPRQMTYDYGGSTIPSAPVFHPNLIANISISSKTDSSLMQPSEFSEMPAVLAKSANRPGAPKPFTYTPGGLDLSKLIDAARNRRQRQNRSYSIDTENMNRRTIVPSSEQMNQHHYTGKTPIVPFSYARQQPTPPRKQIQHDTDAITQSRSFQMLEEWIHDSEKTIAALEQPISSPSSAVSRAVQNEEQYNSNRRRSSLSGQTSLPSRSFRYLQEQYSVDTPLPPTTDESNSSKEYPGLRRSSDAHTPSRSFKFLQEQYVTSPNRTQTVNNRDDLMEIYNKPPPSFREREPEAPRYTGATVPSRSFRFLQMMTQDDQQNDPRPVEGYTKPQQLLNKYDEENLTTNSNRLNEHPSRSFKYLQEITGEQKSRTKTDSIDLKTSDF